jgi:hypothetical protein
VKDKTSNESTHSLNDDSARQQQWVADRVNEHLNSRVESLDFNVTSRLSAARYRALAQSQDKDVNKISWTPAWLNRTPISPAILSGLAMATLVAVVGYNLLVGLTPDQPTNSITADADTHQVSDSLIDDMPMLSSGDDLEFFQTLELLEWMENNAV